jgi:hypothetical protein
MLITLLVRYSRGVLGTTYTLIMYAVSARVNCIVDFLLEYSKV